MFDLLLTGLNYESQTSHDKAKLHVRMHYSWVWAVYVFFKLCNIFLRFEHSARTLYVLKCWWWRPRERLYNLYIHIYIRTSGKCQTPSPISHLHTSLLSGSGCFCFFLPLTIRQKMNCKKSKCGSDPENCGKKWRVTIPSNNMLCVVS